MDQIFQIYNITICFTAFENSEALMEIIKTDENVNKKFFEGFQLHENVFGFSLLSKVILR